MITEDVVMTEWGYMYDSLGHMRASESSMVRICDPKAVMTDDLLT